MKWCLLFALVPRLLMAEGDAAGYAKRLASAGLDPSECYRVRDVSISRDELKLYLTDGYLIFARPVDGRRTYAMFSAETEGGDAELLVTPPTRSERLALASFTKSPNLNEHLTHVLLIFTDDTEAELRKQLENAPKAPVEGALMASQWDPVAKNFIDSFEIRLVQDRYSADPARSGFFYTAVTGRNLGNFDAIFDPRGREQIVIGQVSYRGDRRFFDVWTSFVGRSFRTGRRQPYVRDIQVRDVGIDAAIAADLSMKATTRLTVEAGAIPERAVGFELSRRMKVIDIKLDGQPVELFARDSMRANLLRGGDNDVFLMVLPEALAPGSRHTVEVRHEGNVITESGNGVYFVGARDSWYPSLGTHFARFDLTFRFPRTLDLVATGELVESKEEGDVRMVRRQSPAPVRFAGFNLGAYQRASVQRGGLKVEVYANRTIEAALQPKPQAMIVTPAPFPPRATRRAPEILPMPVAPPDPTARLQALAADVTSALETMSAWFGPPPLKTLTVSPIPGTFGQGFPGLLYLSTLAYLTPVDRPASIRTEMQNLFFSEMLQAHEVAHQWWGNIVASGSYQDDWLMEALANYSALMYLERRKGRKAMDSVLESYREHLLSKRDGDQSLESAGPIIWGLRLMSSQAFSAWRAITYEKGSWIIHMLRGRMGDDAFLKMLGELLKQHREKRVETETFRLHAARFLPPNSPDPKLESFFNQWVYGTGIPTLRIQHKLTGKAPTVKVSGTIAQSDVAEDFSTWVPINAQLANKRVVTKWVETSSEPVPFTLVLPAVPVRVQLDAANTVLMIRN